MTETAMTPGVPTWTLGDRLDKALDHSGVSVADMAAFLEVSRNTVGNYIGGRVKVPAAVLLAWSNRTGVPVEWLRTGEVPCGDPGPGEPVGEGGDKLAALTARKRQRGHGSDEGRVTRRYPTAA